MPGLRVGLLRVVWPWQVLSSQAWGRPLLGSQSPSTTQQSQDWQRRALGAKGCKKCDMGDR